MAKCVQCGRQLPAFSFRNICQWCVQHERSQRGEDGDNAVQPVMAAPWVRQGQSSITLTHVLLGANVAVFLAMAVATVMNGGTPTTNFSFPLSVHFGANYGPLTLTGQWWRLVTYMFLHGDIWHIAFNMWCLWSLGTLCESLYGSGTYAGIYLITGVSGGLASVAWNPGVWSVGASGAIFGLAGALIASFYLGEFSLPSAVIQANLKSLLFFAGFNILFGISPIGALFGIHVDNSAHIGGLVSGLILGALIATLAPQRDAVRRISVLALVALAVLLAGFGIFRWRGTPLRMARSLDSIAVTPDRAIAQLQAILRKDPNSVQAHFALAQEFFNIQRYPQAEEEFRRVIALQPDDNDARFDLGLSYLSEKKSTDAQASFAEIIKQDANDSNGHYGMGMALADQEKHEDAIKEFQTAIRLGPRASGVYYEMGQSYAKLKKYDNAISAYLQEKGKDGDDPEVENALADAYQAKGQTQQAQDARNSAAHLKH